MDAFPFSETATEQKPNIFDRCATAREFLECKYDRGLVFGLDSLRSTGFYKLLGWAFDFRPYMKKYVYKQYDQWHEAYAPNKTLLRRSISGRIQRIVEI